MSTRHRWADVITAWANGEAIQWQALYDETRGIWIDWNAPDITPNFCDKSLTWRVKPRMASLNGHEFPAPEETAPADGVQYWIPRSGGELPGAFSIEWRGDSTDRARLRHRRVHLDYDAAEAHARAEILAVGGAA